MNSFSQYESFGTKRLKNEREAKAEALLTFLPDAISKNEPFDRKELLVASLKITITRHNLIDLLITDGGELLNRQALSSLNTLIAMAIESARFYGGDVVDIDENKVTVLWEIGNDAIYECIDRAIRSATRFENTRIRGEFTVSHYVTSGRVVLVVIGSLSRHWVLLKPKWDSKFDADGDLVVSKEAWSHLEETRYDVLERCNGDVKISSASISLETKNKFHREPKRNFKIQTLPDLKRYVPKVLYDQIDQSLPVATEVREVTKMTITIKIDDLYTIDRICDDIDKAIFKTNGFIYSFIVTKKELTAIVLFGLEGDGRGPCDALESGRAISEKSRGSVAIATELGVATPLGNSDRRAYVVVTRDSKPRGAAVACDEQTRAGSRLPSLRFRPLGPGCHAYAVAPEQRASAPIVYDRERELRAARDSPAVLFKGPSKSGKTALLANVFAESAGEIAFVTLCSGRRKPYTCASFIYKQLYDGHCESYDIKLSHKFCEFDEILQMTLKDARERLLASFDEMCRLSALTVIIVDNVQFIDKKSLELIDEIVRRGSARFVSAGTFDERDLDLLWRFASSDRIRTIDLSPVGASSVPKIVCRFLNVDGVAREIVRLIAKTCDGRPGWIESCLVRMIKIGELRVEYVRFGGSVASKYVFPFLDDAKATVSVVDNSGDERKVSLRDISLSFIQSFPPYQQVIIKTASVLGDMFSRSLLIVVLEFSNSYRFTYAIKCLFDEEVFECGAKYYANHGRLTSDALACLCYVEDDFAELPKYAFCKIFHFKNRILREIAYRLLPSDRRKDLHAKITDLLEYHDNSCPNCVRHHTGAITMRKYEDMVFLVGAEHHKKVFEAPLRCSWDTSRCFCLEILMRAYDDLVRHSQRADHLAKRIFFMYQYGSILILVGDLEDAIVLLKEACTLCNSNHNRRAPKEFIELLFSKIVTSIAEAYFYLDDICAARNYVVLSLRRFDLPLVLKNYSLKFFLNKVTLSKNPGSVHFREYVASSLILLTKILAFEGKREVASMVFEKTMSLARKCNLKIFELDASNDTLRVFEFAKTLTESFLTNSRTLVDSIQLGYRSFYINYSLRADIYQYEVVPVLSILLMHAKRIEEAVQLVKIIKNNTEEFQLIQHVVSINLLLDTGFYLKKIESIERFTKLILNKPIRLIKKQLVDNLILGIYNYYVRAFQWDKALEWKSLIVDFQEGFIDLLNKARWIESRLILLAKKLKVRNPIEQEVEELKGHFKTGFYKPFRFIYSAYFSRLRNKKFDIDKSDDTLIAYWSECNETHWNSGKIDDFFTVRRGRDVGWRQSRKYSDDEQKQLLYRLPVP